MKEREKKLTKAKRVWKHALEKAYYKKVDQLIKNNQYDKEE